MSSERPSLHLTWCNLGLSLNEISQARSNYDRRFLSLVRLRSRAIHTADYAGNGRLPSTVDHRMSPLGGSPLY